MVAPVPEKASGELRLRIFSAVVLAPAALAAVYWGGLAFKFLVAVAALGMIREWDRLWRADGRPLPGLIIIALAAAAVLAALEGHAAMALLVVGAGVLVLLVVGSGLGRLSPWWGLGLVYIGVPCIAFAWLRQDADYGRRAIIWLLLVVWSSDVGSYISGRLIGGPKLAPRLSPKKTWAGVAGGIVAALTVGMAAAEILGGLSLAWFAVVALAIGIVSQLGDLTESAVKRYRGVKDTGSLIPGHGGMLDRLDGLLAGASLLAAIHLIGGENIIGWR